MIWRRASAPLKRTPQENRFHSLPPVLPAHSSTHLRERLAPAPPLSTVCAQSSRTAGRFQSHATPFRSANLSHAAEQLLVESFLVRTTSIHSPSPPGKVSHMPASQRPS